jgi:hypothetical protein
MDSPLRGSSLKVCAELDGEFLTLGGVGKLLIFHVGVESVAIVAREDVEVVSTNINYWVRDCTYISIIYKYILQFCLVPEDYLQLILAVLVPT